MSFKKNSPGCNSSGNCGCSCEVCGPVAGTNCASISPTLVRGTRLVTTLNPGGLETYEMGSPNQYIELAIGGFDSLSVYRIHLGFKDDNNSLIYEYHVDNTNGSYMVLIKRVNGVETELLRNSAGIANPVGDGVNFKAVLGNNRIWTSNSPTSLAHWSLDGLGLDLGTKIAFECVAGSNRVQPSPQRLARASISAGDGCPMLVDGCIISSSLVPPSGATNSTPFNPHTTTGQFWKIISGTWTGDYLASPGGQGGTELFTISPNAWIRHYAAHPKRRPGGIYFPGTVKIPFSVGASAPSIVGRSIRIGWNLAGDEAPTDYLQFTVDASNNQVVADTFHVWITGHWDLFVGGGIVASTPPKAESNFVATNSYLLLTPSICIGEGQIRVSHGLTLFQYAKDYTQGSPPDTPYVGFGTGGNGPGGISFFDNRHFFGAFTTPTLGSWLWLRDADDSPSNSLTTPPSPTYCSPCVTYRNARLPTGVPIVKTMRVTLSGMQCKFGNCKKNGTSAEVYTCNYNGIYDLPPSYPSSDLALFSSYTPVWAIAKPATDPAFGPDQFGVTVTAFNSNTTTNVFVQVFYPPMQRFGFPPIARTLTFTSASAINLAAPFGSILIPHTGTQVETEDICNTSTPTVTLEGIM